MMCGTRHEYVERPKKPEMEVQPMKVGKCENCGREGVKIAAKGLCAGLCYFRQMGLDGEERVKALRECREKVAKMNTGERVRGFGQKKAAEKQEPQSVERDPLPAPNPTTPALPRPIELHLNLTAEFMNVIEKALKEARA
jgi:hypothetical protein